jgi:hypothetical protein
MHATLVSLAVVAAGALSQSVAAARTPETLVGVNYTHYGQETPCSLNDRGILAYASTSRARRTVRRQLRVMHRRGIQTIRLLVWNMTDASGQRWGIVSSAGGYLHAPARANLVYFLEEARLAGFRHLSISFAPEWTNMTLAYDSNRIPVYDPGTFEANWNLLREVRRLAKRYGPRVVHIDLINEGMAGVYDVPQVVGYSEDYIRMLYSRYYDAFGNADVSVSLVGASSLEDNLSRLQNLVDVLHSTGRPMPHWFELHPSYDATDARAYLRAVDQLLTGDGLRQPLVLSEVAYDDPEEANAIETFIRTSSRRVTEVDEWPLTRLSRCKDISVSPPFRADAYLRALSP